MKALDFLQQNKKVINNIVIEEVSFSKNGLCYVYDVYIFCLLHT